MSAQVYPGKGLSIFQLAFALNEELKRTAYSPSFTFEQVSQLDHHASAALATIREWRNSFIPINRVPLDILSLIPTHLVDQKDRFRASFVCRHWRRTLLQRAELWSQLLLSKGDVYTKTLLGRAKGSALDVVLDLNLPISRMALFSPRTRQIRSLSLSGYGWKKVQRFLEVVSGPLPLLRTLKLFSTMEDRPSHLDVGTPPCSTFFDSAVNLRTFYYHSSSTRSQYLRCFLFPNITSFDFSAETLEKLPVLQLLDFLEASPMLQTVCMRIIGEMSFDGVPQGRVVVLSRVETFNLCISEGGPDYRLAVHISCPSAKRTSLTYECDASHEVPEGVFPGPVVWKTIVHQYTTRSPAEEVTLEMNKFTDVACKLTFRSSDAAGIDLYINAKMDEEDEEIEEWSQPSVAVHHRVFTEAIETIRNYRHLAHIKRVRICHDFDSAGFAYVHSIATDVRQLLKSVGPLDELSIYNCDLQPYFYLFLDFPEGYLEEPIVYPPIKTLAIMHQTYLSHGECIEMIADFAKSQHARGNPLERVVICDESMPERMEEELGPWVGRAEYFNLKDCGGRAVIGGSEDAPHVEGHWCVCLDAYKNARPHVQ